MTKTIKCISPIDGSTYAERSCVALDAAREAVASAKGAQAAWASLPLQERIDFVTEAVAEIGRTQDRMVTELAHQMGRPVRYGGEFGGFEERATLGVAALCHADR